jgi:2'-5' RNA ligase
LKRLFFAIDSPETLRAEFAEIQSQLKSAEADVRWEPPQKFHATISFLGEVAEPLIGNIVSAAERIASEFAPFEMVYSRLGCFPSVRRPRVIWIGAEHPPETLVTLKQELDAALSSLGILIEERKFQPHVTLGRINDGNPETGGNGLHRLISTMESLNLKPLGCRVSGITLIESRLLPRGSEYTSLATCALQKH